MEKIMAFEGLICPACSNQLDEIMLEEKMICPHCSTNLKQKKFLAFLEFLMMNGLVTNIDFFDQTLYGDEIKKTVEEINKKKAEGLALVPNEKNDLKKEETKADSSNSKKNKKKKFDLKKLFKKKKE